LIACNKSTTNSKTGRRAQQALNKLDKQTAELMANAEQKCRKIKSGRIPFSPEAAIWIRRTLVYKSLLRYHQGLIRNRGNLNRTTRRCGIGNCFKLLIESILQRVEICREKCNYFRKHGKRYRTKHLHQCAKNARDKGDDRKAQEILEIIRREKDRSFWRRLNYSMGKQRGAAPRRVLVENPQREGDLIEFNTQATMQEAIFDNVHRKWFFLAEAAPICQEPLRELFGYNADISTANEILEGTYEYPEDFDQATREICQECHLLRQAIPKDSLDTQITTNDWKAQWRGRKEATSSSESELHFGHYIAGAQSDLISCMHAGKATLVIQKGIMLDRWSRGLSVMIEKIPGCALITKLRSILLMEADFNATNKLIYGNRMLNLTRKYDLIPDEVYSKRNRLADDGTLAKTLFYDIVRQLRWPAGIAVVDADNCYDRIAHPIASLIFQSLGVPITAAKAMLSTIQNMKFFLRTGYGDSLEYAGSTGGKRTQGLCQGNGAAPAGWTVTTIPMIHAHRKKGHGVHIVSPITKKPFT